MDDNRTQNYVYDSLNRIQQGYTNGSNWGQTFTVDPWGNLTNIDGVAGKTNPGALAAAPATTKNQLTGYTYDAAGNLSNDNLGHAFTYDAENRIVSTAGATTYVYDGDGQRVIKCAGTYPSCSSGTLYWTGVGSDTLSETALDGTSTEDYFYFNGLRVARVDRPSNLEHLYINDHLGTARMVVTPTGSNTVTYSDSDYSPYGIEVPVSGSDPNRYKFTGKERDTESGLDDFGARYDASTLGRFMTPDPLGGHLLDPQTLNKYAYVRNNPVTLTDPTGLDIWLKCGGESATCHKNHWWNRQRYVGTWDKDHKHFGRTHLTGDQTKNATLGPHGISVNYQGHTYQGVWDTNKGENGAVTVAGTGAINGYDAQINGNCGDTCVASGSLFNASNPNASTSGLFAVLSEKDSGYVKEAGLDAIDRFHPGAINFRGYSDGDPTGIPSTHIPIDPRASTPQLGFHVDSVYPYDSPGDFAEHTGSVIQTLWNEIVNAF